MDKNECVREKYSSKFIGTIILIVGLLLALVSFALAPFVGLIFALPIIILAIAFITKPDSKVCRLILGKAGSPTES